MRTDRQTDMAKLIIAFRNLGTRLKNCSNCAENFRLSLYKI